MKIIQDNYGERQPIERYVCENCNSVFEYEDSDIHVDHKTEFVICPCCGHDCIVYESPTIYSIKFPKDFYHFGDNNEGIDVPNEEITKVIKDNIAQLEKNPEEPFRYTGYGNMFLCVFNHEDEYYIVVCKNYFDSSIDK